MCIPHILENKKCSHAKKNFRVRATQFQIGENNQIFKVNLITKWSKHISNIHGIVILSSINQTRVKIRRNSPLKKLEKLVE